MTSETELYESSFLKEMENYLKGKFGIDVKIEIDGATKIYQDGFKKLIYDLADATDTRKIKKKKQRDILTVKITKLRNEHTLSVARTAVYIARHNIDIKGMGKERIEKEIMPKANEECAKDIQEIVKVTTIYKGKILQSFPVYRDYLILD